MVSNPIGKVGRIYSGKQNMKCLSCSSKLKEVKFKNALIDICPECKGIWFDSGEFVDFVKTLTESEEISPQTPRLFEKDTAQTVDTIKEKERVCPKCGKKLEKFNYAYDSNVFLDKCPSCEGLWADGGEVKEVARYLKEDPRIKVIGEAFIERDRTLEDLAELSESLMKPVSRLMYPFVLFMPFMPKIIIPFSDDNPRQRIPTITISIIILCTLIFIGQAFFVRDPSTFYQRFGFIPARFLSIGLISSMFLHGGLLHLIGNMFFLWLFGDNVEDRFSRVGFLVFYICCGISASILHSILNWDLSIPAIGASGAISGIIGAYLIFYPTAKIKLFVICRILHTPAFLYLGTWFLFQLIYGFIFKSTGVSSIAWFAHIGGFAFGGLVAYFFKKIKQVERGRLSPT